MYFLDDEFCHQRIREMIAQREQDKTFDSAEDEQKFQIEYFGLMLEDTIFMREKILLKIERTKAKRENADSDLDAFLARCALVWKLGAKLLKMEDFIRRLRNNLKDLGAT